MAWLTFSSFLEAWNSYSSLGSSLAMPAWILRLKLQALIQAFADFVWHDIPIDKCANLFLWDLWAWSINLAWLKLENAKIEKPEAWKSQTFCNPSRIYQCFRVGEGDIEYIKLPLPLITSYKYSFTLIKHPYHFI